MRWVLLLVMTAIIAGSGFARVTRPASHAEEVSVYGPTITVGNLKFTVPSKWQVDPPETSSRAAQWRVPPLHGEGEGGQVVVFYFGTGIGGSAKENIEAWIGTMFNAEGQPAAAEQKHHDIGGLKISQVVIFGTYDQSIPIPGIPPASKANYGLLGAVIENPQGNIYWRFTGPEALVTANVPLFNAIIDSVKVPAK